MVMGKRTGSTRTRVHKYSAKLAQFRSREQTKYVTSPGPPPRFSGLSDLWQAKHLLRVPISVWWLPVERHKHIPALESGVDLGLPLESDKVPSSHHLQGCIPWQVSSMFLCQTQPCFFKTEEIYTEEYFHQRKIRILLCFRRDYPEQELLNCVVCMLNNSLALGIVGDTCSVSDHPRSHKVINLL